MVTIKDVATKAGVTAATVSMALNNKPSVSEETRRRIQKIAQEMNYQPSATAKALRTNRSHTLGLIVGSLKNEFFMEIIYAVEEYAASKGYIIFVCDAERSSRKVVSSLRALASRGVDGILISLGFYPDSEIETELRHTMEQGIKVLSFTSAVRFAGMPLVHQNELDLLSSLVDRVVALGHRRIGILSSPEGSWLYNTRLQWMVTLLKSRGVYNPDLVWTSPLDLDSGKASAGAILDSHADFSVLMCINDMLAVAAVAAALERGIRVPADLSITGIDGIYLSRVITPQITTISLPRFEMGSLGCRFLIEWIETGVKNFSEETQIACSFIEGKTLAEARKEEK